ncbi:MAG: ribonuclease P protein component [Anaerolineae bacterium]|nr:ribonuclease P protein component [Anaerolineae bacterium]
MQRQYRLRRREDFARLRKQGRVWRHRVLVVSVIPNGLAHNRYGFITSKHLGKAVVRNRMRRRLREVVRRLHPLLKPGYDLAFIARQPLVDLSFPALYDVVWSLLQQANLIQPASPGDLQS